MSRTAKFRHTLISVIAVGGLIAAAVLAYPWLVARLKPPKAKRHQVGSPLFELVSNDATRIRMSKEAVDAIGLKTIAVVPASAPDPLLLPGYLSVDANKLVPVHSRFPGEVVLMGQSEDRDAEGRPRKRLLRYGDRVQAGQVLAMVWSTDIGTKKSELVDALSRFHLDELVLERFEKVGAGVISQREIAEARRAVEADRIAILSAKRTLISWRLSEEEIAVVEREADQVRHRSAQTAAAKTWAELEIRAPIDGVIVEKNVNVGEIVDTSDNLFKIADLSRIQVLAYVYEEDLPLLERLGPQERQWQIDLKSDPNDQPRPGRFELIGDVIDSTTRTGPVIGWIDNHDRKLRVNQFVTARVDLPADPTMVSVPTSALIEEGSTAAVFVETDAERHEVARRVVAVTRRGEKLVFIRSKPNDEERHQGAEPLSIGERVVMSGGLELDAELTNLQSLGGVDTGETE